MSGFRKFLMRGNLIDLAVAVVVGLAFAAVVSALVKDLITPLIGALGGSHTNFSKLSFSIGKGNTFFYGDFVNAVIYFVIVAAVIYFLVVSPFARIEAFATRNKEATTKACPECTSTIPIAARRCMYCTAVLEQTEPPASDVPAQRQGRHGQFADD